MAKYLSIVNFGDADLVREAARWSGLPVHVGTKVWRSDDDGRNKVTIYTESPDADHAPFFRELERLRAASNGRPPEASDADPPANDDRQVVRGRVISGDRISVVRTDPIKLDARGRAEAEIVFDRPVTVSIPLEALVPDPQDRADMTKTLNDIFNSESSRIDDLAKIGGLDPAWAFMGQDLSGTDFIGTPDRPIDLRKWNLSGCDLSGSVFEHVLVDETTILEDAILDGITGSDADAIRALVAGSSYRP